MELIDKFKDNIKLKRLKILGKLKHKGGKKGEYDHIISFTLDRILKSWHINQAPEFLHSIIDAEGLKPLLTSAVSKYLILFLREESRHKFRELNLHTCKKHGIFG